jgi:hypothetical protein
MTSNLFAAAKLYFPVVSAPEEQTVCKIENCDEGLAPA